KVPENATLIFSFVGYKTQEIATTKSEKFEVKMEQNAGSLNEVVVVGYGSQKRAYATASVTTAKAIMIRGMSSQTSQYSGYMSFNAKVPGLQVADPGARDKEVSNQAFPADTVEYKASAYKPKPV